MKHYLLLICLIIYSSHIQAEDTKILSWFSQSALDSKTKRKFEAKFKIKLGDIWKNEKPEILIKTLDTEECIMQVSDIVALNNAECDVELVVGGLKDFKEFRLCLRTKTKIEYFRQTWAKREKEPIKEVNSLKDGEPEVVFFKKIEASPVGKSVSECKLLGMVMNIGMSQAKMIRIKATISNALGAKIKDFEFLLEQDKKPLFLDGGDKFKIDRIENDLKGFAGGKFGITWESNNDKDLKTEGALVGTAENIFEYGKIEGDVQITKIITKVVNKTDLSLKVTIYNGMAKPMLNPVITIKLMNDKGELIQPITLEFEGELGSKETAEIRFRHKSALPFSGIIQSIKYATKN